MREWGFAQTDPSQQLAQLHYFSIKKPYAGERWNSSLRSRSTSHQRADDDFFAQADKETTRVRALPPRGWGRTLLEALSECVRAIERFPYEGSTSAGA